jgi:hypothetical protein
LRQIGPIKKRRGAPGKVIQREQNYFQMNALRMTFRAIARRGWPDGAGAGTGWPANTGSFQTLRPVRDSSGMSHLCALDEARRNPAEMSLRPHTKDSAKMHPSSRALESLLALGVDLAVTFPVLLVTYRVRRTLAVIRADSRRRNQNRDTP